MIFTPKRKNKKQKLNKLYRDLSIASTLIGIGLMIVLSIARVQVQQPEEPISDTAESVTVVEPDPCTMQSVYCDGEPAADEVKAEKMLEGTPMEGLGKSIVDTAAEYGISWRVIIGIAEAESNRGAAYWHSYDSNCHNAWGIKPPAGQRDDSSYLRCYYTWQDGINSIASLLARRYASQTPEEMCGVYVQPCNERWLRIVNQYLVDNV